MFHTIKRNLRKSLGCIFMLQMFAACLPTSVQAVQTPYVHRLAVTPHPQEVFHSVNETGTFKINASTTIHVLHEEDAAGVQLLTGDMATRSDILSKPQQFLQYLIESDVIHAYFRSKTTKI